MGTQNRTAPQAASNKAVKSNESSHKTDSKQGNKGTGHKPATKSK